MKKKGLKKLKKHRNIQKMNKERRMVGAKFQANKNKLKIEDKKT